MIRQYVALLREHDELLKAVSAHDAPKLSSRGRAEGRPRSPVAHAAEKFGVDRATVKRALAADKPKPVVDHSGVPGGWPEHMARSSRDCRTPPMLARRAGGFDD